MRTSVGLTLVLLLVGLPLAELYAFGLAGQAIGLGWTVLLTILTAIVGVSLVRRQGRDLLLRLQAAAERGEPLLEDMLEGVLLALSGICLFLPGLLTDAVGFVLLVPPARRLLILWGIGSAVNAVIIRRGGPHPGSTSETPRQRPEDATVIDVEPDAVRYEDDPQDDRGRS